MCLLAQVWRNLFFSRKGVPVLKGMSGYIKPGMCVAVIGAPDSGATSLLKVLAGRTVDGKINGDLLVNGRPPTEKVNRTIAYIPKEDINLPMLTVRETFEFSFALRCPVTTPYRIKKERIDVALQLLGLSVRPRSSPSRTASPHCSELTPLRLLPSLSLVRAAERTWRTPSWATSSFGASRAARSAASRLESRPSGGEPCCSRTRPRTG